MYFQTMCLLSPKSMSRGIIQGLQVKHTNYEVFQEIRHFFPFFNEKTRYFEQKYTASNPI